MMNWKGLERKDCVLLETVTPDFVWGTGGTHDKLRKAGDTAQSQNEVS
jgi:hypothetical protein